jgi:membrane-associated phospholipid phosphatase
LGGRRALLVGAVAFLASFLTLIVIVVHHRFDGADRVARTFVHQPGSPLWSASMEAASFWGGETGQIVVVVLGFAILWRRRRRWALALPVVMAGAGLLQLTAKWTIHRPRPNLDPWGFPSAHVLSVVVLLGCLTYLVATSGLKGRWRALGIGLGVTGVGTVAYSRMYLDAHWLSDVLGGLTIGLAYLLLALWLVSWLATREKAVAAARLIVEDAKEVLALTADALAQRPGVASGRTVLLEAPIAAPDRHSPRLRLSRPVPDPS